MAYCIQGNHNVPEEQMTWYTPPANKGTLKPPQKRRICKECKLTLTAARNRAEKK